MKDSLLKTCLIATFCRFLLNTGRRFGYPFAPALSRGLGVSLPEITAILAVCQSAAIFGVFFGPLIDRIGYRIMMIAGISLFVVGALIGGLFPLYWTVMAALFLFGFGKAVFDPALQAYIGQRVPYNKRGLVIGVLEFGWAASTLIGIPLIGMLMEHSGWRSPFFALGGLGVLGLLGLIVYVPPEKDHQDAVELAHPTRRAWKTILKSRPALGAIAFGFCFSAGNDAFFVVYGVWMEQTFSFSLAGVGVGACVIGMAELCGEFFTAVLSDRFGLKRSVIVGVVLCTSGYFLLLIPVTSALAPYLGPWAIFMTFEFTIVTFLSMCTEILPQSRASMMAAFLAATGAGRVAGDIVGGLIWPVWNIQGIIVGSMLFNGFALIAVIIGFRRWRATPDPISFENSR